MWSSLALLLLFWQQGDPMSAGLKALDAQQWDVAAAAFQKAVAMEPKDYAAHFHLGLAYSLSDRDSLALPEYREALTLKPGLYEAQLNLGVSLLRLKQPAEALSLLMAAQQQKPTEYRPNYYLGQAYLANQKPAEAAARFTAALEKDPQSAAAEYGLASAFAQQQQTAQAAPHFQQAAKLDPTYRDGLLELAAMYEREKQFPPAIEIYRQFPQNPAAQERLGSLLLQSGQSADAIAQLEQSIKASPTAANRFALASAYLKQKQPAKALPLLEEALKAEPQDMELRMAYGRVQRDLRNYPVAAKVFASVTQAQPQNREAWNEFAGMLILLENYPQALAALDKVQALGNVPPGYHFFRAIVLDKLQQPKPALESYQQFLAQSTGQFPDEEFKARQRVRILQKELSKR